MKPAAPRLLIVEDDPDMRATLAETLRDEGYYVVAAAHGREALDILRDPTAGAFDLILLDLMMPVMNGWQFRKEQQSDPAIAGVPVVVLSAGTSVPEAATSIGAAGFLRKPIKIDALLVEIERFTKRA